MPVPAAAPCALRRDARAALAEQRRRTCRRSAVARSSPTPTSSTSGNPTSRSSARPSTSRRRTDPGARFGPRALAHAGLLPGLAPPRPRTSRSSTGSTSSTSATRGARTGRPSGRTRNIRERVFEVARARHRARDPRRRPLDHLACGDRGRRPSRLGQRRRRPLRRARRHRRHHRRQPRLARHADAQAHRERRGAGS